MKEVKRCSGHKSHWECSEEYPDHEVPRSEFGPDASQTDGLHGRCGKCRKYYDGIRNPRMPRHPDTNQRKIHWLTARAKEYYGGMPKDPKNDKRWKLCREMATKDSESIAWVTPDDSKSSNVIPFKVEPDIIRLETIKVKRFDDGRPKVKRVAVKKKPSERTGKYREGPGYVYIYQDERIPEDLKIGSSKTSYGRLNSAGTWGLYRCLGEYEFEKRYMAEDLVHEALIDYRLCSNKEIFKVGFKEAAKAIQKVAEYLSKEEADENAISKS